MAADLSKMTAIRLGLGFEVFNACCGLRSILMPDAKQMPLISTQGRNKH